MQQRALVLVIALGGALILTGAALAGNGGLLPVGPHSPNAQHLSDLYLVVLVFVGIVLVAVEGVLLAFVVRYRRGKRRATTEGPQIHGSARLQILGAAVPAVLITAIVVYVAIALPGITNVPAAAAIGPTITVEGHQGYWLFRYPNGAVSIGTMVAPADQVVQENVLAPTDESLHSWWIPALGGEVAAVPGRVDHTWFKAPVGDYAARSSELGGTQTTLMTALVRVVPAAEYDRFVAERAAQPSSVALGKEEYQQVCASCHHLTTSSVGPPLSGNATLTTAADLTVILRSGVGRMPAVGSNWSTDQIAALIAYAHTLKLTAVAK